MTSFDAWPDLVVLGWCLVALAVAGVLWFLWRRGRRQPPATPSYAVLLRDWLGHDDRMAERHLRALLARHPNEFDATLWLGHILRRRGRARQAFALHRQLLGRQALTQSQRAQVLAACLADGLAGGVGAPELEPWANALLALEPNHPFGHRARAEAWRQAGDMDRAAAAFRRSVAAEPGLLAFTDRERRRHLRKAEALYLSREGDRAWRAEDLDGARRLYRRAVRVFEGHAAPYLGLARVAHRQGRSREALRHAERAHRAGAETLALDVLEEMHTEAADQRIEQWVGDAPQGGEFLHWVRVQARRGEVEMAFDAVAAALAGGETSVAYLLQAAELADALGRRQDAVRYWRQAARRAGPRWRCSECQATLGALSWQCPRCAAWDTVRRHEAAPAVGVPVLPEVC